MPHNPTNTAFPLNITGKMSVYNIALTHTSKASNRILSPKVRVLDTDIPNIRRVFQHAEQPKGIPFIIGIIFCYMIKVQARDGMSLSIKSSLKSISILGSIVVYRPPFFIIGAIFFLSLYGFNQILVKHDVVR